MSDYLSPIEWLLRQVNKPVAATAGAVLAARQGRLPIDAILANLSGKRQDSFGDVLRNEGVDPGPARVGGFALDVALDPLNLVPIAKLAKVTGAEKGVEMLGKIPGVQPALSAIEHHLNPVAGLPEDYAKGRRLLNSSITNAKAQAVEDAVTRFQGTTPLERDLLSSAIEKPEALNAITDPTRKQQLTDLLQSQKDAFAGMAEKEIGAGVLKREQVEKILGKNGGYVPYIFDNPQVLEEVLRKPVRELSGQSKFATPRTLDSFEAAKELGATTDLAKLSAKRQAAGDRAILVNNFLDEVFANPEWARPIPGGGFKPTDLPGWRTITTAASNPVAEKVRTYAVAPEIAGDLEKLFQPKEVSAFMKGFDKLTNMWKATATTMKPGFHLRNAVSNSFNMWLGGVSPSSMPKRYAEASALLAGKVPAKIGAYSGAELIEKMKQYGVMGREFGFVGDLGDATEGALNEFTKSAGRKVGEQVATLGLKGWNQAGRALGAKVEDASKVALFLDRIRKGESAEDAALSVKKYLFDYQELTDTERHVLRRAVPFYCVPEESDILTREGFKSCDEVKVGEEALAYNIENDCLEWQPIEDVAIFDHAQDLLVWQNKNHKLAFTPEHRWAVKTGVTVHKGTAYDGVRSVVEGRNFKTSQSIIVTAPLASTEVSLLTPEQARLYGWLVTDGYWRFKGNYCEAIIYQHPTKFIEEVMEVAGGEPRQPHPDTGVIAVPVLKERVEPLIPVLKRGKKQLTSVITQLSPEALRAFCEAAYLGDGGMKAPENERRFMAAQSPDVREALRVAFFLLGKRTTPNNGRGFYISNRQTLKLAAGEMHEEFYAGRVWCPKTANGTWVMRQNDVITITGNTWLRKNIPLQLEHLYKDTDKYSHVASAYNETEGLTEDKGIKVPSMDRPDFLKKLGAVQMPFLSESGEKEFFNPNLPFQDLGKLSLDRENLQDQLSSLHPIAKAVIERGMNQSIFKDRPLYKDSSSELVDAPMSAQLFASTFPDLGKQLGIKMVKVNGEARWQMPEWASYTLDQIPVFNTLGKAAVNIGDSRDSAAPLPTPLDGKADGLMRPPALDFLLGMKFLPQSNTQLRREKKFQRQEAQQKRTRERKAARNTLTDDEIRSLLGE